MNKKRKLGIILIIIPIALFLLSFILTLLSNFVFHTPTINIANGSVNIVNIILMLLSLISMISFPILVTIGIIMIVKNKDSEVVESVVKEDI